MAITYSYPTATPETQDLLIGTEMALQGGEDAPRTRTFTVGSIISLAESSAAGIYATITSVNLKANIESPTFTGVVTSPSFFKTGGLITQYLMADGSTSTMPTLQQITTAGATTTVGIAVTTNAYLAIPIKGTNMWESGQQIIGVLGEANSGTGVKGTSISGYGVYGASNNAYGVIGTGSLGGGVYGQSGSGYGVLGYSSSAPGVYGTSSTGYGGRFSSDSTDAIYADGSIYAESNVTASGFKTPSGTITEFLKANGTVDDSIYRKIVARSAALQSGGGSTSPMLMHAVLIPANTFTIGDFINLRAVFSKSNSSGGGTARVSINTVDSLQGAMTIATYSIPSSLFTATLTREWLVEGTNIRGYYNEVSSIDGVGPVENFPISSTATFSTSSPIWFLISVEFQLASDSYTYRGINITN